MTRTAVYVMMTLLLTSLLPVNVSADSTQDIPTNAAATGIHDSLVAALSHVDLVTTLEGTGPFTVFAPTDQAFTDAGIDLNDFTTAEEKAVLSDILLHHVYAGEVPASAVTDGMLAEMVNGDQVKFSVSGGTVSIGSATVTSADVQASNGIIHVIDTVLTPPSDIPTTASSTGIHDSLVAAVIQADLLTTLEGNGPFTLFAPTDQAFTDAGIDLAALDTPAGKETLADILLYHVVSSQLPASAVTECLSADAANGQPLSFTVGSSVMVNDANITMTDVVTSNGLIHVIDKVLTPTATPNDIPRTAQCTGLHDSLVAGVIQAELLATLQGDGPFTVFAPTDQAFADAGIDLAALDNPDGKAALTDILLYHVLADSVPAANVTDCMSATTVNGNPLSFTVGTTVMVNGAQVTATDVATSNGIIHVIDKVLTPTPTPNDIPRTAQCTGQHNALVSAVVQADLLETLQGEGPFTLFAPTDTAFAEAGIDLAALDTPEGKATLADILLYHVVAGSVASSDLTDCMTASTVNGQPVSFTVGESVMVNGATVSLADVQTSNGVIHVIDTVLTPSAAPNDIPRSAQCTGIHNSLVAAVIQADLLTTLQGEGPFTLFAPTDEAFAAAGIDLAALDTPEGKEALRDILLYHVHMGLIPGANITDGMLLVMANGDTATLATSTGSGSIDGANFTLIDVMTSNGIIHVIDAVILPPEDATDESSGDGVASEDDSNLVRNIVVLVLLVLVGAVGAVLFLRSRTSDVEVMKDLSDLGIINYSEPIQTTTQAVGQPQQSTYAGYETQYAQQTQQVAQPVAQSYAAQPAAQAFATQTVDTTPQAYATKPVEAAAHVEPIQTVEVIPEPVAAEPVVVQQWTDANGYTWRKMSDDSMLWWTGTDWQKHG